MQMTNIKINGQDLSRWTDCLWHLWMGQHSEGAIGLTYVCVVWSERFTGRHGICVCVEAVGIQSGRWDLFRVWYLLQKRGPNMFSAFFLRTKHQYAKHVSTLLTRSVFLAYSFCFSSISYSPCEEHLSPFHIGRTNLRNTNGAVLYVSRERRKGEPLVQGVFSRDYSAQPDSRGQPRNRQARPQRRK